MLGKLALILALSVAIVNPFNAHPAWSDTGPTPAGESGAKAALDHSPRHHEWVNISVPGTDIKLNSFIAYPERKEKAPVVIVIHEVYGLTDWIRAVADQLAADGFLAIAPDLLSGRGPGGGGTGAYGSRDDVVKAVMELSPSSVATMLDAVKSYGASLPAATPKFGTVGFCWGGAQSFYYATVRPELGAAVVYYGVSPSSEALNAVHAPVLGLYGEDDARVVTTIGPAAEKMKELSKTFITHIYKGAGHGFLRAQDDRNGANLEAARQAWPATIEFFRRYLE
jgi:carboxymethylenebutenolidase